MEKFKELPYSRPDFEKIKISLNGLLNKFESASDSASQELILEQINALKDEFSTANNLSYIRNSINTTDVFYEEERNYFDGVIPLFDDLNNKFYACLASSKFRKELESKFGSQLFALASVSMKTISSAVLEEMKEENLLSTEYSKLVATAQIEFDGKKLNLSGLSPYTQTKDRAVRQSAAKATYKWWAENAPAFDEIFDKLVKLRTSIAKKLGYENFTQLGYDRMKRTDYDATAVKNFREQVLTHIVPLTVELRKKQAKRIGIEDMKFYDVNLNFTSGNPTPKGDPDWILANAKQMYQELSPETNEFFDFMVEKDLMDLVNKPNKQSGGYCTSLPSYNSPFIFSNFNGTSHDVVVLTHEAGHAFQGYESRHQPFEEYQSPTYEACEIHSMSMEFFTWPWMKNFFIEDNEKFLFSHLAGALLFLPYGCAVDEFQHEVYANPTMTPTERNKKWAEIDKKYRPYMDYDGIEYLENGGLWKQQLHIYGMPFYYIDYCLAQICALQFWKRSREDFKGAWADYLTLCKAGGSQSFLKLVELANLKNPFELTTIKPIVEEAKKWLESVDDMKL